MCFSLDDKNFNDEEKKDVLYLSINQQTTVQTKRKKERKEKKDKQGRRDDRERGHL